MTMLRAHFSDFFFSRVPFVDHTIWDTYGMYPEEYRKFFRVKGSSRAFENVLGMAGLGHLAEKGEDEPISYDRLYQGKKSQYIHTEYALGVRTSETALEDDIDGILKQSAVALGRSASYTPEIVAAAIINNGETANCGLGTDKFTAPGGEALFTASHANLDGSTYSNLGSADFSITALRDCLNNIGRITDERSKLVRFTPNVVFGAPEMQYIFQEVLNSSGKSGTADNDLNAFRVLFNLSPQSWHYLTDTDAWYVQCMPTEHELWFFWRRPFRTDHDTDFDTGGVKSKISGRFSCGFSNWRGIYASTP